MYTPGERNSIADGLSRTLFSTEQCEPEPIIEEALHEVQNKGATWICKDGKGGFDDFPKGLSPNHQAEVIDNETLNGVNVFMFQTDLTESWEKEYENSPWYGDVYRLVRYGIILPDLAHPAISLPQ